MFCCTFLYVPWLIHAKYIHINCCNVVSVVFSHLRMVLYTVESGKFEVLGANCFILKYR